MKRLWPGGPGAPSRWRSRERRMLLRRRIALVTALVVAVAITGISTLTWVVTQHNLTSQLDESMLHDAAMPAAFGGPAHDNRAPHPDLNQICAPPHMPQQFQQFVEGVQLLRANHTTCGPDGVDLVRTQPSDWTVTQPTFRDGITAKGTTVRVLLHPAGGGQVVLTSQSLTVIDGTLTKLGQALVLVSLLGVAVAGTAGLLLARGALAPMSRLTSTAEHIARTQDLDTEVDVTGRDEVGRLGRAFTAMTTALAESRRRQRDLVADAAHELRTPLTSLRTNIDLLVRSERSGRAIPEAQRARLLDSLQSQAVEFGNLVNELVTLARDQHEHEWVRVDVPEVVDRAVRRAATRAVAHHFDVRTEPWTVTGDPTGLERMVLNLLDNAVKFSPPGSTVTVRSGPGWLTVADQGTGIPKRHRDQVFDRFWRAPEARALPGSGLGLAIVAGTVTAHGGTVTLADPPTPPGTTVHITLPAAADHPEADDPEPAARPEADAGPEQGAGPETAAGPGSEAEAAQERDATSAR